MKLKNKTNFFTKIFDFIKKSYSLQSKSYLLFLHRKMISKKKYISNIKSYFIKSLDEINYSILTSSYKIHFNESERKFLRESISCSKIIKQSIYNGFNQREIFICKLNDVKLFGISGGVSYHNKVIAESFSNVGRLKRSICVDSIIFKHKHLKGTFSSIIHLNWAKKNIFHWLIECLPRLYALTKLNESKIVLIVHKDITQLQMDTLRIILDERFKLLKIGTNEIWKLENFYLPSFCNEDCSGYMPKIYLDYIKNKIIKGYNIEPQNKNLRLYISRYKTGYRCLKNEEQFFDLLKEFNFIRIYAEDLPFKKQVELFNSAKIIISIHGAGLSNMIFSEFLKVIEIFPPNDIKTHYFMLCKALGFEHYYIIGSDLSPKNSKFFIDLSIIENLIKKVVECP